jgi:hypothetical protein
MLYHLILALLLYQSKIFTGDLQVSGINIQDVNFVKIIPQINEDAFPNPLKGFRSSSLKNEDYPTLTRLYIKWNEIENSENDGVEKIVDYCNNKWNTLPGRNIKVIPRVYLEWPYETQKKSNSRDTVLSDWGERRFVERFWPADMIRGDYSSDKFKRRLATLIEKMGKAWDNDPRVAYIEMGLIGWWGEQHSPSISDEMQKLIGDSFVSAFRNKLIMIRYAKDFTSYPFGSYWDSFAHTNESDQEELLISTGDKWKTSVRGGELAYDWGERSKTGTTPDESLKVEKIRNYLVDNIRKLHWNHLGWINEYDPKNPGVSEGAAIIQKNLGYRFIIDDVTYTSKVLPGGELKVIFSVRNTGSSPFYYNWPVEVSLLDQVTRQPVWKSVFKSADIRTWMPGDKWDPELKKYTSEPKSNTVTEAFILPADLKKGKYILALSILDPADNMPAVRFAVRNYFKGGRHPIGMIGINTAPGNVRLADSDFDDLKKDRTLFY